MYNSLRNNHKPIQYLLMVKSSYYLFLKFNNYFLIKVKITLTNTI